MEINENDKQNLPLVATENKELSDLEFGDLMTLVQRNQILYPKLEKHYSVFIEPDLIKKAYDHIFLEDRINVEFKNPDQVNKAFEEKFKTFQEAFFKTNFWVLEDWKLTFESTIQEIESKMKPVSEDKNLGKLILPAFKSLLGVKKIFTFVEYLSKHSLLKPEHISALYSFGSTFSAMPDQSSKSILALSLGAVCEVNQKIGLAEMPEYLTPDELKTLMFACPVFYSAHKFNQSRSFGSMHNDKTLFYSFFNDFASEYTGFVLRSQDRFPSREVFPEDILIKSEILIPGKSPLILTPYLDVRLKEMNDPRWSRFVCVDPYAIIFTELPGAIQIRRWSTNGILPGIPEMIAATVHFLKHHKDTVIKRLAKKEWLWSDAPTIPYKNQQTGNQVRVKIEYAENLINSVITQFNEGKLKEFIKM